MSPKLPEAGANLSDAEIAEALASVDNDIAELLQVRAAWVARLATGSDDSSASLSQRVSDVLNAAAYARGESAGADSDSIFRQIDALCRRQHAPINVAFLGPLGTYTHDAALHLYGESMNAIAANDFAEIFSAVENGTADFGVAPIENSTEGAVNQTHDLLTTSELHICGEVRMRIRHCLMSHASSLENIKVVYAHPQSLAQCRQWLNTHLPGVELVTEPSNAAAADRAAQAKAGDGVAAIASASAAERYGLEPLEKGIEDIANNTTRFIVVGKHRPAPTGDDATSLLISAPHKPGGLRRMLQPFEDANVSLIRIESRPARTQLWEYVFFIDVKGHCEEPKFAEVLKQLQDETPLVRVLGSYPRANS